MPVGRNNAQPKFFSRKVLGRLNSFICNSAFSLRFFFHRFFTSNDFGFGFVDDLPDRHIAMLGGFTKGGAVQLFETLV